MTQDNIYGRVDEFVSDILRSDLTRITSPSIILTPPGPNSITNATEDRELNTKGSLSRLLPITLVEGYGIFVRDSDGNEYRDHFSGATAANLGYGLTPYTEKIIAGIIKQMFSIQHVPYMYFSNTPATKLAKKLIEITPPIFDQFHFPLQDPQLTITR